MTTQLIIADTAVRQDAEGRYNLNDLHKASGGEKKNQPGNWLRMDATRDLVEEISRSSDVRTAPVNSLYGGRVQGTFVVKGLVCAYAMWIGPTFNLKVIRKDTDHVVA